MTFELGQQVTTQRIPNHSKLLSNRIAIPWQPEHLASRRRTVLTDLPEKGWVYYHCGSLSESSCLRRRNVQSEKISCKQKVFRLVECSRNEERRIKTDNGKAQNFTDSLLVGTRRTLQVNRMLLGSSCLFLWKPPGCWKLLVCVLWTSPVQFTNHFESQAVCSCLYRAVERDFAQFSVQFNLSRHFQSTSIKARGKVSESTTDFESF